MSYYLKLNLPKNPLKNPAAIEAERVITGGYNLVRPEELLSDQVMDQFAAMDLKPKFVSLFGRNDKSSSIADRLIHADVAMTAAGSWKKLLFGINWEIEDCHNVFSWYDMTKIRECWPDEELSEHSKYKILNGIHYVHRGHMGVPLGAVKLDETVIDGPTLVRTEVPHLTLYKSNTHTRLGISVRFDESDFGSWQDVLDKFKPYELL